MRELAGTGRGEAQHLQPMGEQAFVAAGVAELDIVMDRVIVPRQQLEGCEMRLGDGAAGQWETLAHGEILEPARRRQTVPRRIERHITHHGSLLVDRPNYLMMQAHQPFNEDAEAWIRRRAKPGSKAGRPPSSRPSRRTGSGMWPMSPMPATPP